MSDSARTRPKVGVIGLDGAVFPLLSRLADEGVMPNIAQLLSDGVSGTLESVIPTNSIAAWSSFMTGKTPDEHGAFSFLVRSRTDFDVKHIVNATFLRGSTLWDLLGSAGTTVGVYNVPMTYPVQPVNGFLVSGLMTPSTRSVFTFPEQLTGDLLSRFPEYTLDVGWMRFRGRPVELVDELIAMTRQRVEAFRFLTERHDADFWMCVFISPDRIQHALWKYLDPSHPSHDAREAAEVIPHVRRYFRELDMAVGDVISMMGNDSDILVMSDHGFHANARQVLLNEWLAREGFLRWRSPTRRWVQQRLHAGKRFARKRVGKAIASRARDALGRRGSFSDETAIDWSRTLAYSTWETQQGISVNLRGREPNGVVESGDAERIVSNLQDRLNAWRDSKTGQQVIAESRISTGDPYTRTGSDISLMPAEGYAFSRYTSELYGSTGWASGGHSLDGIVIGRGPRIATAKRVEGARIIDLAPTILHLLGHPVPTWMSGQVLTSILDEEFLVSNPIHSISDELVPADGPVDRYSAEDSQEIEERLRSLGYLS